MLALIFYFLLAHRDFDQSFQMAWNNRCFFLLGIADERESLPWSITNAARPPGRIKKNFLPLHNYQQRDQERNRRLYGYNSTRLKPTMIVLHFTVIDDADAVIRAFSRISSLAVGNQRPVRSLVSVHYMVDKDGSITQLAPENRTTSGTYGVDHLALAIEMVALDEKDLKKRPLQLLATFHLVDELLERHDIPVWRVFSHQEIALGKVFFSEYTDLADTVTPYFYPEPHFRYDPGHDVMAWCREFLLRRHKLWDLHPASGS